MGSKKDEQDEEKLLREVGLKSAQSIFLARKRAEEELRRTKEALEQRTEELASSLAMMRATFESTTDSILTTDRSGRITNSNSKFLSMWQLDLGEVEDLAILIEIWERRMKDPLEFSRRVAEIIETLPADTYDLLELVDGRYIERYSRIQYINERNIGRVWTFRDVTEQRRDEELLRRSESEFRELADAQPQIVWTARPDGYIDYFNERWYEYTGFERGKFGDDSWKPILHPEDVQPCLDTYYSAIRSGTTYEIEYRFRDRRTGGYRWFLGRAFPARDDQGQVVRWYGTCTDIHDTKKAAQSTSFLADASAALAELTDYQSTLQKVAFLAVPFYADWCAVDMLQADGSVSRLAVTHVDPAKVRIAHELFEKYPPRWEEEHGAMKVLRSGQSEWFEMIPDQVLETVSYDQEHLDMIKALGLRSLICVPLKSRSGTQGVLTFATAESGRVYDVSDLRAAEDLASRAVIAIDNARLVATLKETDHRKDEFLAILAHELRNPLAPMRSAVQILRAKGPVEPDLVWARDVIDRQIDHMTRLVDDLLDVSRITRGRIELRQEDIEIRDVVNAAVEASRPVIDLYGHQLSVEIPSEAIYLRADPARISQVLQNLLNNASKYMDEGGRIWLSVEVRDDQVWIRVRDTGIGLSREMLPKIFDMFTQVDSESDRSKDGLGIGLTLVDRVVRMHGGRVEAKSEGPGRGSEFTVRLPALVDGPAATAAHNAERMRRIAMPTPRRILVVDDNKDAADSLALYLRIKNHTVRAVHDGVAAIEETENFSPEVILLDIGLPELSGYEVAKRIRRSHGKVITIIALTGWGQQEDRRRSQDAGFDHHLTKPVDFDALTELIEEIRPA